jgi:MFS-type transporter involved in bile tolerance (Atg22 family)
MKILTLVDSFGKMGPEGGIFYDSGAGEAFGLFNIVGYLSGVVGAIFWGVILLFLSSLGELGYRIALFSLNLFIVFALIFLLRMNRKLSKNHLPRPFLLDDLSPR